MTGTISTISLFSTLALSAVGLLASGCRCSKEPAPGKEAPVSAVSVRPSASAAMSAPPSPSASGSNAAKPAALEPATGSLPASIVLSDPPVEYIGSVAGPDYSAHRLRGVVLVAQGLDLYKLEGHALTHIETPSPSNARNAIVWEQVYAFYGSWPNHVWAEISGVWVSDGARIHDSFSDTWLGKHGDWNRISGELASYGPQTTAAWSQGRVLGLSGGELKVLEGPKSVVPKRAIGSGTACPVRVDAESIAALPSGELYAMGRGGCDDNAFLVERWNDASADSVGVDRLPPAFSDPIPEPSESYLPRNTVWLEAALPNTIYALRSARSAGTSRLARFDGTSWQELPAPAPGAILGSDVGADGSLWIMLDRPYVFDTKHRWRSIAPPNPPMPEDKPELKVTTSFVSFAALDATRAYFGVHYAYLDSFYQAAAIISTDPVPLALEALADAGAADAGATAAASDGGVVETGSPVPFSADCTTPFVVLFSVSPSAPADFAYPATRDALLAAPARPDVKFVEFSYRGSRTLGASAAKADQAEALVRLISERVKGSKPTLMCFAPSTLIREVKLP